MIAERWNRIKDIFEGALACPPESRHSFLNEACDGDSELRAEIERLLAHDAPSLDFLESPAMRVSSFIPLTSATAAPGQIFSTGEFISGRYEILRLLGRGGMGEVYAATDRTLGGEVAIKTIRPEIASDQRIMTRFQREIQLSRAVTHANVCRVFDIASCHLASGQSATYLTMEILHGEPLSALLRRGDALPMAVRYSLIAQMAEGLAAAHRAGVIHRDLKPSNVFLARAAQGEDEYRVVITDFGLACTLEKGLTDDLATDSHIMIGTLAYMAPEQLRGGLASAATDVYAFGLIVDELLSKPAESGRQGLTPDWQQFIARCLDRAPERRFEDAVAILRSLPHLQEKESPQPVWKRPHLWRWALAAALLVLAAGAWFLMQRGGASPADFATGKFLQLTTAPGQELYPSFSPGGDRIVYAGQTAENWDLYLQKAGEKNAINLTQGSGVDNTQPAFSPDGRSIVFRSERDGGGLFILPVNKRSPTRLSEIGYLPAWSPDGKKIACSTTPSFQGPTRRTTISQLIVIDAATGNRQVLNLKGDAIQPNWSPHGKRIAFWRSQSSYLNICSVKTDGGAEVCITSDSNLNWNPVWSPDGRFIYYASDRGGNMNLWRVPVDENTGNATGPATPIQTPSTYSAYFAISRDGRRLAYSQVQSSSNLEAVPFDPVAHVAAGNSVPLTRGSRVNCCPEPSPDGRRIAFGVGGAREGIWVINADGSGERELTANEFRNRQPRWSPDGKVLSFTSNRSGHSEVWTIHPDGTGLKQLTRLQGPGVVFSAWAPDGRHLLFDILNSVPRVIDPNKAWDAQTPATLPFPEGPRSTFRASNWSPNGGEIAGDVFGADGSERGMFIYSLKTGRYRQVTPSGSYGVWLNDGHSLLFLRNGGVFRIDPSTGLERKVFGEVHAEIVPNFGIAPDQKTIYVRLERKEADIWLGASQSDKVMADPSARN